MAGTDAITVYRGEDIQLDFTMSPVENITGWTLLFTVEGSSHATKLISKAGVIVSGAAGTFKVTLTATETDIRAGVYQYDFWRTDSGSNRALAVGTFTVSDVARHPTV